MGPGDDLESLTEKIFRALTSNPLTSGDVTIERNVMLDGADGPRQIDVLIRTKAGPIDLTTIIECKDYKKRIAVPTVDALHSVAQDVNASRAVLVTRGGFSKTAVQKAKRLGIGLYTADRVANVSAEMFQVPIYVREVRPSNVDIQGNMHLEGGDEIGFTELCTINGQNLLVGLRDHLVADDEYVTAPSGSHAWVPNGLGDPMHLQTAAGDPRLVENLEVVYTLIEKHYFGYLSDVAEALVLSDQLKETSQVLLPAEALVTDYVNNFTEVDSVQDVPVEPVLIANVAVVPDPETDMPKGHLWMKRADR